MQFDNIESYNSPHNIQGAFHDDSAYNGSGGAALAGAAAMGFAPFPFNPFFIPIQMTMFIILIIILMWGFGTGFFTAAVLAYLIPAILMTAFHYMILNGAINAVSSRL